MLPELWGGSADLAESNNTTMEGEPSFIPAEHQTKEWPGGPYGRTLHFGIREHAMGAIINGITLHGGTRVYGGTFLVFSDYMRPPVRLAALMQLPSIFVWTHDSIGLGGDGPTHQPIEHLAALRAIPGLDVVRPADANETAVVLAGDRWRTTDGPAGLALSRQNLPVLDPAKVVDAGKGGYILEEASSGPRRGHPDRHRLGGRRWRCRPGRRLEAEGTPDPGGLDAVPRVVRRRSRRPTGSRCCRRTIKARVSVEAGVPTGLARDRRRGRRDRRRIDHFGASAEGDVLFEQFGFTPDRVVAAAHAALERAGASAAATTGN